MSQRKGYALPNTPAVQLDDVSDFPNPIHSPVSPSTAEFRTEVNSRSSGSFAAPSLASSTGRPGYPPGRGSVVPLLSDDALSGDAPERPLAWMHAPKSSYFNHRARLHPFALVPALLLGVFLTMSGVFGGTYHKLQQHVPYLQGNALLQASRASYYSHPSGHLFVDPASIQYADSPFGDQTKTPPKRAIRHPIHDLISNATAEWENKLARQSKTLREAVVEYKKRYGRNPPKGFDQWFQFAQANDVILIDEFDNINRDLKPFWALPPQVIRQRALALQQEPWTFTMNIKKGKTEITGAHKEDGRARDQKALMERWTKWVPDVNLTMSAHDGPSIMLDYDSRQAHIDAAEKGELLSKDVYDNVSDPVEWGFPNACPPDARLRRQQQGLETASLPLGPSFVQNHLKTMDMCENPEWQYLHGFTSWTGMPPKLLQPIFSFSRTSMNTDILMTPLEQYWDTEPWDPDWEDKPNNKAVWRGSTTGVWFIRTSWWRSSQRVRLWFMSKDKTGSKKVRFDGTGVESAANVETIAERNVPTHELMERYVDFGFTGKASQCDEEDGSCAYIQNLFDWRQAFGWNEANEYKYLLDIDGNAWSGRFHRLLSSKSVVLKSTIFPEWYSGWIQPWVHYVPIKIDYTDLFDVMAFFSGDMNGENGHEELAKAIAQQGREYTANFWRYQDMEAYFFRLALEWARVSSMNRGSMDYTGPGTGVKERMHSIIH